MPSQPSWRLLPVDVSDIPNLLVSTAFNNDSYTIHLTDMANLWVETMERRSIIKRGLLEDTSIDPSDGPDQIKRMLELIRASLDNNDPAHSDTSLSIAREDDNDSLVVHVTCLLPKPLMFFKWPIHLKKCPQSGLATELVLPLVQAHEARMREINHLVATLKEKDSVIARLVDKLEAAGMGLEHVFSSLSGKRKVTRAAAEGRVKGLAPFSEADFKNNPADSVSVTQSADTSSLLEGTFGATGLTYKSDLDLEASTMLNDWWTKIGKGKQVTLSAHPRSKKARTPSPPPAAESKPDEDDDDFQVQATPPHLLSARKRNARRRAQPSVDDDETSSGEENDEAAPSPSTTKKEAANKPSASRLGNIGRPKAPSRSPVPHKTPPKRTAGKAASKDDDTETGSDIGEPGTEHSPPSPSPAKPTPKRGGLGRIGGKSKEVTPAPEPVRSTSPATMGDESSQVPKRHRLGIIGKKAPTPEVDSSAPSDDSRGRSKTPASSKQEHIRETSQERADRKRAELQRDLEKRAAAGPAKKKRKF
ncbi:XRCC4-like factor-domain-containing protein [Podospora australis]|uniref:Non-homologous end-joining factor 1 n=1 Tax=Podospora australis TaxID=1536484 RepID=A0AAN6WP80_9PEZI|nr:XRCC4-like factor-domain-containing protein [Podospora australis]